MFASWSIFWWTICGRCRSREGGTDGPFGPLSVEAPVRFDLWPGRPRVKRDSFVCLRSRIFRHDSHITLGPRDRMPGHAAEKYLTGEGVTVFAYHNQI